MIPENWIPKDDESFFYTNCIQRTIATAQYFSSGMMPVANVKINHKDMSTNKDNFFVVTPTRDDDAFKAQVKKEIDNSYGEQGIYNYLKPSIDELEKVIDFKNSEYAKSHNIEHMPSGDINPIIVAGKEFKHEDFLEFANQFADTLAFQYLEEPDDVKAGFGKPITYDQMKLISKILSANMRVVAGTYTLACNGIQPLLQELSNDINNNTRKFTFLCGHDTTTTALMTALKVKDSSFSNTFTEFAPIGAKVVINKYKDKGGEEYCKLFHVYESTNQIRFGTVIDLDDGPVAYPLELEGLNKNQDGYYKLSDISIRFTEALKNGGM